VLQDQSEGSRCRCRGCTDARSRQLAAAISTGGSSSARAARQARAAEVEAADDVETARSALASLKADLEDVEAEAEAASKAVNVAVAAALTLAREMLEEAKHFRAEFLARQYALDVMRARWGR
jgi:small-conductance mechanosensitive channel